jgi:hypothetical protein
VVQPRKPPSTCLGKTPNLNGRIRTYNGTEHTGGATTGINTDSIVLALPVEGVRQFEYMLRAGFQAKAATLTSFRIDIWLSSGQNNAPLYGNFERIFVFD